MDNIAATPPESDRHRVSRLTIGVVVFILLGFGGAGYYYFIEPSAAPSTEVPNEKIFTRTEIGNPVSFFRKVFSAKDYQVSIKYLGKSQDRESYTFFFQKGILVRINTKNLGGNFTTIYKNQKIYVIDENKKLFVEENLSDTNPEVQALLSMNLINLILDNESAPWASLPDESTEISVGYSVEDRGNHLNPNAKVDMKIFIDARSGFLRSASTKFEVDAFEPLIDWQAATIEYDEVADIESLKRFPLDYTKNTTR